MSGFRLGSACIGLKLVTRAQSFFPLSPKSYHFILGGWQLHPIFPSTSLIAPSSVPELSLVDFTWSKMGLLLNSESIAKPWRLLISFACKP